LMKSADIVVIGGGCMGTSIVYNLKRNGVDKVTLLEKQFIGSGATGRSAGVVRQHYSTEFMVRMATKSLRMIRDFQRELGTDSGYRRTGLIVAVSACSELGSFHRLHVAVNELQERLSAIDRRFAGDLEIEQLIRYPRVERRLQRYGLDYRVSHDPRNVPDQLI